MLITPANQAVVNFSKAADGLLPAMVQHPLSGEVLMQGYMNSEALAHTLSHQRVTFFSRSKQRLWTKGESSEHFLQVVSVHTDCDQDSLLIRALPLGPTCHLGSRSCFSDEQSTPMLQTLMDTISSRRNADPSSSYTASLFAAGIKRAAQKVGEEGVEVALAATAGDNHELLNESADLLYHLLVVLAARDLSLNDVLAVLQQRHQPASTSS
ncbi:MULTISPECIES: bifunctional phosphoribosyl-AMP cyclohydrolase/phosphoribosyl-ATP diphosphatase HisIE [Pseudidiomarina]|uniref:Histidine biosynthesis bifunctional protein HisIE n=2 Tax=Pseudidiomarina TaxID=2800384 RepID=A0A368V8J8_9GAMM|nr:MULTISPECIES: bifunctional phosphoribosyl-AMP cyclohydrolase/phosphoribosyl-ATP diphosphatase HisIE [Pseudidiomarina]PWW15956.1 phosphoribosyl-ATP pyrophosphatase /phosphoribosyl-AMP cyclohydrolase [Pseudidiomarina maritima]RBP93534.1 phosphoribosyl-ATP pyrophosphatase /phosphoribosyl-AMP cyclohydrolase [Pseudidiomarina tainanensis]RCW35994.1 phosphoribosyl-ATP pyrophosphatase /phosphoribosyl-AMP cyclohydrolase [Pseudidiomarina tainanensis]